MDMNRYIFRSSKGATISHGKRTTICKHSPSTNYPWKCEKSGREFEIKGSEEKTQREVADMLGISQSYISRLEKKIIVSLKKEFAKMS